MRLLILEAGEGFLKTNVAQEPKRLSTTGLGSLTTSDRVVADGITEASFRRLPALLCLYWQVYLRWGKNKIVVVVYFRVSTFGEFVPRLGISATFGEKFGEL